MILRLLTLLTLFCSACLHADTPPPYDPPNKGPYTPPANPTYVPETVTVDGNVLLPILLYNDSDLEDTEVYIIIQGRDPVSNNQGFVKFEKSNGKLIGTFEVVENATSDEIKALYIYPISFFHQEDGQYVAYTPFVSSGRIYFSLENKLNFSMSGGALTTPSSVDTADTNNYNSIWDWIEFTYNETVPQLFPNTTSVDQFSLPLYLYLHVPDPSSESNGGFYQPRSYVFQTIKDTFSSAPASTEWNKLVLQNTSMTDDVRIISPALSISTSTGMDPNYLYNGNYPSNPFDFLGFLWGSSDPVTNPPYYKTNDLYLTIPAGSLATYKGNVDNSNNFTFVNQSDNSKQVSFQLPAVNASPVTDRASFIVFGSETFPNTPIGGIDDEDVTQLNKFISELIIIGIIPKMTTAGTPITLPDLVDNQTSYYPNPNTELPAAGQSSGPWYSLYSQAIHYIAMQFSSPYDDALWPQTQLAAPSVTAENKNFIAIWVGPKGKVPSKTILASSNNPSTFGESVTFTATVTSQSSTTTDTPTGTIIFSIDGVDQPAEALDGSGKATYTTSSLSVGSHTIGAKYSGDTTYEPSEANPTLEQIVQSDSKIDTQTQLVSTPKTTVQGEIVTFTATVLDGASTPNGIVEFEFFNEDTSIPSQSVSLDSNGIAVLNKNDLPIGQTAVRAVYQGNSTFDASKSNFVVQTVNAPGKLPTTTEVGGAPNPASPGQTVIFTARVNPPAIPNPPPLTGYVTFSVDGIVEDIITLVNGQATYSTNTLAVGTHSISASYSGNDDYSGSSSQTTEQIIDDEFPPNNPRGFQKKNKFASQTEYVNKLIWYNPNTSPLPIRYDIYRDINLSIFVASVGGASGVNTEFVYLDRRRKPKTTYRYYIVAVYEGGEKSLPAEIVIN